MTALSIPVSKLSIRQLQAAFLGMCPRIVTHARIFFRNITCRHRRDDYVSEVVALCWRWFRNLARRGKDARRFVSALATYAARAVHSGRRVCGQLRPNDVLSERAQRERGFRVESLPISFRTSFDGLYGVVGGQRLHDAYEERLQHDTQTPIPDQVAFRCDFPAWLRTRTERDRRLIHDMARNDRTLDLATKYKMSPGRISQLRREFHEDWTRFTADRTDVTDDQRISA